jgi:hypothetical protein
MDLVGTRDLHSPSCRQTFTEIIQTTYDNAIDRNQLG